MNDDRAHFLVVIGTCSLMALTVLVMLVVLLWPWLFGLGV